MKISPSQVSRHLRANSHNIYIVLGEELLLSLESFREIRDFFVSQGYDDRKLIFPDHNNDWENLENHYSNMSLFSNKQLIEIRVQSTRLGRSGTISMQNLANRELFDTKVIILISEFDKKSLTTGWLKKMQQSCVVVQSKKLQPDEIKKWIHTRLAKQGQAGDHSVIDHISEKVEGDLLAASQEIKKLALTLPPGNMKLDEVSKALKDVARFDVYDLSESVMKRNANKSIRIMLSLKFEGQAPALVLWAIVNELRYLLEIKMRSSAGVDVHTALKQAKSWGFKKKVVPQIIPNITELKIRKLLEEGHNIDLVIKGLKKGNSWESLIEYTLNVIKILKGEESKKNQPYEHQKVY